MIVEHIRYALRVHSGGDPLVDCSNAGPGPRVSPRGLGRVDAPFLAAIGPLIDDPVETRRHEQPTPVRSDGAKD